MSNIFNARVFVYSFVLVVVRYFAVYGRDPIACKLRQMSGSSRLELRVELLWEPALNYHIP